MTKFIFKLLALSFSILIFSIPSYAQKRKRGKANRETVQWRYELESVGVGTTGLAQIKVWSYSNYPETAKEQAKKNAVHGVCFRGYLGDGRVQGKQRLVTTANEEKFADFFKEFFKNGGEYLRFVEYSGNGDILPGDLIKIGKKEYKVGVVIKVDYNGLRSYLEEKEIVEKLGGRF